MKWVEALGEALRRAGPRSVHLGCFTVIDHFLPKESLYSSLP